MTSRPVLTLALLCTLCLASWIPARAQQPPEQRAAASGHLYLLPIIDGRPTFERVDSIQRSLGKGGSVIKVGFSGVFRYMADVDPERDYAIVPTRLEEIVAAARASGAPFLVHLNGGRWAGGGPLIERLGADPALMAWDHLDRPWRHLVDGEYHFSLALANEPYRRYKERNLKAASAWLSAFAAGPDGHLLAGVSTDSEVTLNLHPFADYNPMAQAEFVQWLSGDGPYGPVGRWGRDSPRFSLRQVNERLDTNFGRWKDVRPPRVHDNGPFWRAWTTFRTLLVDHSVQEQVDWIREAGLPAERIFSHQSPRLNPDVFGDALSTAQVEGGHLGVTLYGDHAMDVQLLDEIRQLDPIWGVFEYNLGPVDAERAFQALDLLRARAPRIVCPYHWDDLGGANEVGYTIKGSPLEEALRRFVTKYADQPLPGLS